MIESKNNKLIKSNRQFAWIALHFPYLKRFNGDFLNEKFSSNYVVKFFIFITIIV